MSIDGGVCQKKRTMIMQATGDERKALPHVKDFAESQYPGSIVVFHGAVFWDDNVFVSLDETHRDRS